MDKKEKFLPKSTPFLLLLLMALFSLFITSCSSPLFDSFKKPPSYRKYRVTGSSLNMRSAPRKNANVKTVLKKDEVVLLKEIEKDWALVLTSDQKISGYVALQYIEDMGEEQVFKKLQKKYPIPEIDLLEFYHRTIIPFAILFCVTLIVAIGIYYFYKEAYKSLE